jgi:mannose/fructose/N-acetylgalactosamine-specific phosphotransferase system component IIB
MSVVLTRVDDRLIHGQVVVGWAQALRAQRIALVDDAVSASPWEQELTIVLVPDVPTVVRLCARAPAVERVNVGGLHDQTGRAQRLTYVYLSDEEASQLRHLTAQGIEVTAQDVPTARAVPVEDWT